MGYGGDRRQRRSDSELLAAHVRGDGHAFEELFQRHRQQLHRLARRRSCCPEDAADALQDAMLAAHRGAGSFRQDAAVSSWLYRIVINSCQNRMRTSRAHPTVTLEDRYPIADRTAQVDTAIVVRRALLRLPRDQRVAVVSVHIQGHSVAETARALGVAEGTVKSRCARARARLAALLANATPAPDSRR